MHCDPTCSHDKTRVPPGCPSTFLLPGSCLASPGPECLSPPDRLSHFYFMKPTFPVTPSRRPLPTGHSDTTVRRALALRLPHTALLTAPGSCLWEEPSPSERDAVLNTPRAFCPCISTDLTMPTSQSKKLQLRGLPGLSRFTQLGSSTGRTELRGYEFKARGSFQRCRDQVLGAGNQRADAGGCRQSQTWAFASALQRKEAWPRLRFSPSLVSCHPSKAAKADPAPTRAPVALRETGSHLYGRAPSLRRSRDKVGGTPTTPSRLNLFTPLAQPRPPGPAT